MEKRKFQRDHDMLEDEDEDKDEVLPPDVRLEAQPMEWMDCNIPIALAMLSDRCQTLTNMTKNIWEKIYEGNWKGTLAYVPSSLVAEACKRWPDST
jgi:hypothetical protein